jgi:xanthine dehydrogenase YagS FAD-binding subunit
LLEFKHFNPKTVDEATKLLSQYRGEAKVIAGGTDLLGKIKNAVVQPHCIINLKSIPNLVGIDEKDHRFVVGALTVLSELASCRSISEEYTTIAQAAQSVGTPQIRNMGTIGGNLLQDVRCWYYRSCEPQGAFQCIRKGGEVCYAKNGNHRFHHSILPPIQGCYAANNSDMAVALLSMGAHVRIVGPGAESVIPLEQVYSQNRLCSLLKPDEIITEIQMPKPEPGSRSAFLKLRIRKAVDPAIVNASVSVTLADRLCKGVRIFLGGIFHAPYRATEAENMLRDRVIEEKVITEAAGTAVAAASPLPLNGYKVEMAQNLLKRLLLSLI